MSTDDSFIIPKWFIRVVGAAIVISVPWAMWVSNQLMQLQTKLEFAAEGRSALQAAFDQHVTDPALHHSGFRQIERRIDDMNDRIYALDARLREAEKKD